MSMYGHGETMPMRVMLPLVLTACLGAGMVVGGAEETKDASSVLAAAREALGGEKALSAVKAFVATGRTRQIRGQNLVPIEFEIACELPDKYVRKDEVPAQESEPTTSGFNGEKLDPDPAAARPPPAAPAKPPAAPGGGAAEPRARDHAGRPAGSPARSPQGARDLAQAGLRPPRARDVRRLVRQLPADVHLRRPGRGAAGQGRRPRREGARARSRCGCSSTPRRTCRSW